MSFRSIAFVLIATLVSFAPTRAVLADTKAERQDVASASDAAHVKDGIRKLGTGPDTRISVRRKDGKKLTGYVAAADDQAVTVVNHAGDSTTVPYGDVTQVRGQNLSTGAKIAIGAAIGVGVFVLALYIFLATQTR